MKKIDWSKQHCGIIQGSVSDVLYHMPDTAPIIEAFPDNPKDYIWDVKVHMLMPGQWPCIPNWHRDMVPRDKNGNELHDKMQLDKKMWLWVSGHPLTQFRDEDGAMIWSISPQTWIPFTQADEHRGLPSREFTWRGLIRASHKDLRISDKDVNNPFGNKSTLRRHSQVYLDANNFSW